MIHAYRARMHIDHRCAAPSGGPTRSELPTGRRGSRPGGGCRHTRQLDLPPPFDNVFFTHAFKQSFKEVSPVALAWHVVTC